MLSKDAASPQNSITTRRPIRQIQTNPSLMFSAAYEKRRRLLLACETAKHELRLRMLPQGPGAGHKAAGRGAGAAHRLHWTAAVLGRGWTSAHIQLPHRASWRASLSHLPLSQSPAEVCGAQREAMLLGLQLMAISPGQRPNSCGGHAGDNPSCEDGSLTGSATQDAPQKHTGDSWRRITAASTDQEWVPLNSPPPGNTALPSGRLVGWWG